MGGSDLISYERKISDKSSAVLGVGIGGYKFGGFDYSSTGAEVQYRYYFGEALKQWYGAGQAGFTSGKVKTDTAGFGFGGSSEKSESKFTNIAVGAKIGYQFLWDSGFTIDLSLGAAFNNFSYSDNSGVFSGLKGSGILPFGGFGVGYAF